MTGEERLGMAEKGFFAGVQFPFHPLGVAGFKR